LGSWITSSTGRTDSYSIERAGSSAIVISPVYDISGYINVDVNYWDRGSTNSGTMNAEYSLDGGAWTSFSTEAPARNSWTQHPSSTISLSGSTLQLRFTGYSGNIAKSVYLDDIEITGDIPASAVGAGLYVQSGTGTDVQNNIIVAKAGNDAYYTLESESGITVSSSYNTYYTTNTYLFDYDGSIDNAGPIGTGDITSDPLFVGSGNYHVQSILGTYVAAKAPIWPPDAATGGTWDDSSYSTDSPTIDAGNPTHDNSGETEGGSVIDQGSYGNTPQASKSENPLPVTWKIYKANCENGIINVKWSTYSEINNDYFTIEKIINDKFIPIGTVNGAGNSQIEKQYSFQDKDASNENYYRIKQTDFDGQSDYSPIFNANCNNLNSMVEDPIYNIYPNPFNDEVVVEIIDGSSNKVNIDIINNLGIVLGHRVITSDNSKNAKISLKTSILPKGIYFIKISGDGFDKSYKVIKN